MHSYVDKHKLRYILHYPFLVDAILLNSCKQLYIIVYILFFLVCQRTYFPFIILIETTIINYYCIKVIYKSIGSGHIVFCLILLLFTCQYLDVTIINKLYSILHQFQVNGRTTFQNVEKPGNPR